MIDSHIFFGMCLANRTYGIEHFATVFEWKAISSFQNAR